MLHERLGETKLILPENNFLTSPYPLGKEGAVYLVGQQWPHTDTAGTFAGKNWIIDPGTKRGLWYVVSNLQRAGFRLADIHDIYLTHVDSDHAEGVELLKDVIARAGTDVQIHVPINSSEILASGNVKSMAGENYGGIIPDFRPDNEVGEGIVEIEGIELFKIIETPGHCPSHNSYLYLPEKILFPGDIYGDLSERSSLDQMRDSFQRVLEEDFDFVAESHAPFPKSFDPNKGLLTREEFINITNNFAVTRRDLHSGFKMMKSARW